MTVVVFSPHFDDAALGCGQFICGTKQKVYVCTVMGGLPLDSRMETDWDRSSGFKTAIESLNARTLEDRDAMSMLGATSVPMSFADFQYNTHVRVEEVAEAMTDFVDVMEPSCVLAPLGLSHPDHTLTSDAAMRAFSDWSVTPLYLWEELPHRVINPDVVAYRMNELEAAKITVKRVELDQGDKQRKKTAIECYESQLWALDVGLSLAPERFWQVTR